MAIGVYDLLNIGKYIKAFGKFFNWAGKGIGNTVSSLGNRITGSHLTGAEQEANAFSAQQAQLARDYETEMSNTSYQRGVADMQAAGVNPALMYGQGAAGASVPSSPSPTSVNPADSEGPMGMLDLIMGITTWKKDIERKGLENDLLRAEIHDKETHAGVNETTIGKLQQDIEESKSRVSNNTIMYKVYENQANFIKHQDLRYDDVVDAKIGLDMAQAGLATEQQAVARATYNKLTEEAKWIGPEARARIAQYYALVGKTQKEVSLMPFNAMRTVTVKQARSMGVNIGKFFGADGSYSEDTLLLVMPTEDKEHPWEIVGIDTSGDVKSKEKPTPTVSDYPSSLDNTD